jgi:heme-degrading monooxygenase HmoA
LFARVTTYELEEGRASESIDVFEPAIERIRVLEGFVDAYFLVERDGRHAVSMTLWETLDTMERSRVGASSARTEAARDAGAEVTSTYELEVGIHSSASDAGKAMLGGHSRM